VWPTRGFDHLFAVIAATLLLALTACGGASGAVQASRIAIPGADRFSPFITTVRNGSEIMFHNGDSDAYSVVSIPGDPASFDKVLQPGETWTVTLKVAGSYRYYCSIHARFDATTGQVEALPEADHPSEPMEGVVVVN